MQVEALLKLSQKLNMRAKANEKSGKKICVKLKDLSNIDTSTLISNSNTQYGHNHMQFHRILI